MGKLEFHRDKIDTTCVDFNEPFPTDQLINGNKFVSKLIKEVQDEYEYSMSEFQCSWAVNQFLRGGLVSMSDYNKKQNTYLKPRK